MFSVLFFFSFLSSLLHFFFLQLPFDPPPVLPDMRHILRDYIECPERLPIHNVENVQCYWPRKADILNLLETDIAPVGTNLKFKRDPITGDITDMHEVVILGAGETPRNSMSMSRAPGPPTEGVRGLKHAIANSLTKLI